jgi:hypothetical protein
MVQQMQQVSIHSEFINPRPNQLLYEQNIDVWVKVGRHLKTRLCQAAGKLHATTTKT